MEVLERKKDRIRQIINIMDDEKELDLLVNTLERFENKKNGNLWNQLSFEEQQGVFLADVESDNKENLMDIADLKLRWISK